MIGGRKVWKEKDRLVARWKNALIVKLLGRFVVLEYLESKIQKMWAINGEVSAIDVGAGFFVVQFTKEAN